MTKSPQNTGSASDQSTLHAHLARALCAWFAGAQRDLDKKLRGPFRRIQGVVWFEAAKEADWRMTSSPPVIAASRAVWQQAHYRRGES